MTTYLDEVPVEDREAFVAALHVDVDAAAMDMLVQTPTRERIARDGHRLIDLYLIDYNKVIDEVAPHVALLALVGHGGILADPARPPSPVQWLDWRYREARLSYRRRVEREWRGAVDRWRLGVGPPPPPAPPWVDPFDALMASFRVLG